MKSPSLSLSQACRLILVAAIGSLSLSSTGCFGESTPGSAADEASASPPGALSASTDLIEAEFAERVQLLLTQISEEYTPTVYSDRGKFSFPKAMARFEVHGLDDAEAAAYVAEYAEASGKGYQFFHFPFIGMARLMARYGEAPAIQEHREEFLRRILSDEGQFNALTSEGTENHVGMSRTGGYIFALKAADIEDLSDRSGLWEAQLSDWLRRTAARFYEVGNAEWDSSVYAVYNMAGWFTIFDHSPDEEIRAIARAVLDYYATMIALKYSQRVYGGPESRAGGRPDSRSASTEFLGWLWFGEAAEASEPNFWRGSEYIQSIYAATSGYRPPPGLSRLARKDGSVLGTYVNAKPSYLLTRENESTEIFRIGPSYTLGTVFTPYGGWASSSYGTLNWRLTALCKEAGPAVFTGAGGFWSETRARGRSPFDQFVQEGPVLVQMTRVPSEIETEWASAIEPRLKEWHARFREYFEKRWGPEGNHNPVNWRTPDRALFEQARRSFLHFPPEITVVEGDGVVFLAHGATFLAVRSLGQTQPMVERGRLVDAAEFDEIAGFVIEVHSGAGEGEGAFARFQEVSMQSSRLDRSELAAGRVVYQSRSGLLEVAFTDAGEWVEPDYDWNFGVDEPRVFLTTDDWIQPDWPSGPQHGRLAQWWVDGQRIDHAGHRAVIDGPGILLKEAVLTISLHEEPYIVDFSGSVPSFSHPLK
jgi:hypothetical protein